MTIYQRSLQARRAHNPEAKLFLFLDNSGLVITDSVLMQLPSVSFRGEAIITHYDLLIINYIRGGEFTLRC